MEKFGQEVRWRKRFRSNLEKRRIDFSLKISLEAKLRRFTFHWLLVKTKKNLVWSKQFIFSDLFTILKVKLNFLPIDIASGPCFFTGGNFQLGANLEGWFDQLRQAVVVEHIIDIQKWRAIRRRWQHWYQIICKPILVLQKFVQTFSTV